MSDVRSTTFSFHSSKVYIKDWRQQQIHTVTQPRTFSSQFPSSEFLRKVSKSFNAESSQSTLSMSPLWYLQAKHVHCRMVWDDQIFEVSEIFQSSRFPLWTRWSNNFSTLHFSIKTHSDLAVKRFHFRVRSHCPAIGLLLLPLRWRSKDERTVSLPKVGPHRHRSSEAAIYTIYTAHWIDLNSSDAPLFGKIFESLKSLLYSFVLLWSASFCVPHLVFRLFLCPVAGCRKLWRLGLPAIGPSSGWSNRIQPLRDRPSEVISEIFKLWRHLKILKILFSWHLVGFGSNSVLSSE